MFRILSLASSLFLISYVHAQVTEPINSLLGDQGFIAKYGCLPGPNTQDALRIATHLEYVEHLLRESTPADLTADQRTNRNQVLSLLHDYRLAGQFPINYDMPFRAPCFIDRDKTICAVGYLVEQTAGRNVAEGINTQHQYARIFDMDNGELLAWATHSGLTLTECAMIQPEYGPTETPAYYASQHGESFSEFIAERVTIRPTTIDSVNVTCVIDTNGKPSWVRVTGRQPLAGQVENAIKEAKFSPGQLTGMMIGRWPNPIQTTASFQIVFNHPSDSIFVPTVVEYKTESRGTDAQPTDYAKIRLFVDADSSSPWGTRTLIGQVVVIEDRKTMITTLYERAEFLVMRSNGELDFDVRIDVPYYAALIMKSIPTLDADIHLELRFLGRVSTMPYQFSLDTGRLAVRTQ